MILIQIFNTTLKSWIETFFVIVGLTEKRSES